MSEAKRPSIPPNFASYEACLLDLDGVITPTVELHMRAWAVTFERFFTLTGQAPYRECEYFDSLDGRPRCEGVVTLLGERGVQLRTGTPDDEGYDTVCGIANAKNRVFSQMLERDGIAPYPGSVKLMRRLRVLRFPFAVVTSSRNALAVLSAAGVLDLCAMVVDGVVARRESLAGKPSPDTFVYAAKLLGVPVERVFVCEDAVSGVAAARAGGFGFVVGVDRGAGELALQEAGADRVVRDLEELL